MPTKPHALLFAVRWQVVCRHLGQLFLLVSLLNLLTLGVALATGDLHTAALYAALITVIGAGGAFMARVRAPKSLQLNEAMTVTALVFLLLPLAMALPLHLHGIPYVDALFETISAVTTTGLSTLGDPAQRPVTFLFARAWMQWYGGLGIVVLSLALIVRPGLSAKRLAILESPEKDLIGGTRSHARRVLIVYLALTLGGFLLWMVCGGGAWDGLLFTLAAVSTGGFSPVSGSLAALESLPRAWVVTLTCLAGAVPLALYHTSWRSGWRRMWMSLEVRSLGLAAMLLTLLLGLSLWLEGIPWQQNLTHAPLMVLSAQSTAGFSSIAPGDLPPSAQAVLILAMSAGGHIGSTAGGIKLLRILIVFAMITRTVRSICAPPDTMLTTRLDGRRIEIAEVQDAVVVLGLFLATVLISWVLFLLHGFAPLASLFDVVSATGTVGLSTGLTSGELPTVLKLVLCADMLLGRLEFIAWLVLLVPSTWVGRRRRIG